MPWKPANSQKVRICPRRTRGSGRRRVSARVRRRPREGAVGERRSATVSRPAETCRWCEFCDTASRVNFPPTRVVPGNLSDAGGQGHFTTPPHAALNRLGNSREGSLRRIASSALLVGGLLAATITPASAATTAVGPVDLKFIGIGSGPDNLGDPAAQRSNPRRCR